MPTSSEVIQELEDLFLPFKTFIDKYPNAFKVYYLKNEGYIIDCDLGIIDEIIEPRK